MSAKVSYRCVRRNASRHSCKQQQHQQVAQPTSGASHIRELSRHREPLLSQHTSSSQLGRHRELAAQIFIAAWPTSGACKDDSSADIGDCIVNINIKSLADIGSFYIKNELLG